MADFIYTVSKKKFDPINPDIDSVDIEDIAHALSMLSRANGHFREFHSVGQHSIECAREAIARGYSTRISLACLLHDASEAYMADVPTPLKDRLSDYRVYENRLLDVIFKKYIGNLTDEELELVYEVDKAMLYYEFLHYTGIELMERPDIASEPHYAFENFAKVKNEFLTLFYSLIQKLN